MTNDSGAREVVFVFGSNLAGRHGKGAALEAVQHWGAQYGVGEGRTGNAYALPTKDERIKTRPLGDIGQSFIRFWKYALRNPDVQFLLTPFGAGLAGYHVSEIKRLYRSHGGPLRNVWLTGDWELLGDSDTHPKDGDGETRLDRRRERGSEGHRPTRNPPFRIKPMSEVTPEMIEAGIRAYEHGLGVYEIAEIVDDIYLAMDAHRPAVDGWQTIDEWCAKRLANLTERSNQHIRAGRDLDDPDYRLLLGEHRAHMAMRSFIHGSRSAIIGER